MQIKNFFQNIRNLLILGLTFILIIPTFWRMLRPGIFSMHDFHIFRLFEYDKCIADLQIPCRWAPDAAFEYGQPLFNFYAQGPYIFGEVFRFLGFSVLDSIKALFIFSLVLSAAAMFLLSKQLWKNHFAAMISSLVYVYAPYRAVDIFVRGALPESLSFVFFPLIIYFFNEYVVKKNFTLLLLFALSYAGLILTHNLSALMFLPFLLFWGIFYLTLNKAWKLVPILILAGVLVFGLCAFYILPVAFETNLVSIGKTTGGYYDYTAHFVTLNQLLISRYWGYGASLWGEDDRVSLSVGHIQWILPLLILSLVLFKKRLNKFSAFFILLTLGWFALFLTHNKSTPLWMSLPGVPYIQFPWRFLGSAVFLFSLSCGALYSFKMRDIFKIILFSAVASSLIALNTGFFFEDLWFNFTDKDQFSGATYKWQTSSAVNDFWPKYGDNIPTELAHREPIFIEGSGSGKLVEKRSNKSRYDVLITSETAILSFPIVYFPGWKVFIDNDTNEVSAFPENSLGLITTNIARGNHQVLLKFENTSIRTLGNLISIFSFFAFITFLVLSRKNE